VIRGAGLMASHGHGREALLANGGMLMPISRRTTMRGWGCRTTRCKGSPAPDVADRIPEPSCPLPPLARLRVRSRPLPLAASGPVPPARLAQSGTGTVTVTVKSIQLCHYEYTYFLILS
jgi:hypothetical protein